MQAYGPPIFNTVQHHELSAGLLWEFGAGECHFLVGRCEYALPPPHTHTAQCALSIVKLRVRPDHFSTLRLFPALPHFWGGFPDWYSVWLPTLPFHLNCPAQGGLQL